MDITQKAKVVFEEVDPTHYIKVCGREIGCHYDPPPGKPTFLKVG